MISCFLVLITIMVSPPTKPNTQGVLKVEQYKFLQFIEARRFLETNTTSIGLGGLNKRYPKIIGVDLIKICEFTK